LKAFVLVGHHRNTAETDDSHLHEIEHVFEMSVEMFDLESGNQLRQKFVGLARHGSDYELRDRLLNVLYRIVFNRRGSVSWVGPGSQGVA
jgi:hypothetical protein